MYRKISNALIIVTAIVVANLALVGKPTPTQSKSRNTNPVLAPGYGPLEFKPPNPGSYQLPSLGIAADGNVIDSDGKPSSLYALYDDKTILLSFIYSTCSDVNGCPLATMVFYKIKQRLKQESDFAEKLRLITLSFDPIHDRPEVMNEYQQRFQNSGIDWRFLTTHSETELQPILSRYQQTASKNVDEHGNFLGTYSHILRVYLIDKNKQIRNIYSVSFIHADTLINDIKTLLTSQANAFINSTDEIVTDKPANPTVFTAPGDYKVGYNQPNYETHSKALSDRKGRQAKLTEIVKNPPLGLPKINLPHDNPITPERIALGRKLFYDRRLSLNNTVSCAMCHIPEQGFSNNELATAVGIEGRTVRRNAPTIYNVAYATRLFHDARETTLEQQVWGPMLAKNEMANPSVGYIVDKITRLPEYAGLFEQAFRRGPTMETIGMAIAGYERSIISANSAFDKWYYGRQPNALSLEAQRGFNLFTGKAGCSNCHVVGKTSAIFSDNQLHNTGLGYRDSMYRQPESQAVQIAPGLFLEVDRKTIQSVSGDKPNDLGLYEITQNPDDRWKFKTPSLRNIALTAPYMHNGTFETLTEVVNFYNQGGIPNKNLDSMIKPLNLANTEVTALTAFLNSLTGDNIDLLVADAFSAPIGDTK